MDTLTALNVALDILSLAPRKDRLMSKDTLEAMDADIKSDERVLQAKRRIIRILRGLPDDETRRRALGAAAVMLGHADAVMRP